ncbi:MAG: hypothetical protein ACM3PX_01705 [Omnitrophica WOR_2 bacterium]|jgi:hypothetical protein
MIEPFDIEPYKVQDAIIQQTVAQVQKDFGMFGMDIDFPANFTMAYDNLFRYVGAHIDRLLYTNLSKLSSLLYRTDISEAEIMEAWEKHPEFTKADVITELIIYRELKKVLYRNYYKNYKLKEEPEQ